MCRSTRADLYQKLIKRQRAENSLLFLKCLQVLFKRSFFQKYRPFSPGGVLTNISNNDDKDSTGRVLNQKQERHTIDKYRCKMASWLSW